MKIALIQQKALKDIKANFSNGITAVKEAASNGSKIICFSELAFTPFYPQKPAGDNNLNLRNHSRGYNRYIYTTGEGIGCCYYIKSL